MILKIVLGLVLIVAGLMAYAAFQSSKMYIYRELLVKATPEEIFPYINSSKKANDWMPWKDSDPNVVTTYSGPDEGVDSKSSWTSTGKMGVGNAVVVESIPNQVVKTQLTYTKPMEMSQLAEVSLRSTPEGTIVKWAVSGENSFVGRFFCLFMNMDKMVGAEFEKGLNNLKGIVENKK